MKKPGFTLIEMLVALLILAVAVALVHGVASTVQENSRREATQNIEAVVMEALQAYHSTGDYPPGQGERNSSAVLLKTLRSYKPAREKLKMLPTNAICSDSSDQEFIADGFGNALLYFQAGGLAGRTPLLISPGEDPKDATDDIIRDLY